MVTSSAWKTMNSDNEELKTAPRRLEKKGSAELRRSLPFLFFSYFVYTICVIHQRTEATCMCGGKLREIEEK